MGWGGGEGEVLREWDEQCKKRGSGGLGVGEEVSGGGDEENR